MTKRPRVAVIGFTKSQSETIKWLCGEMRVAASVEDYLKRYSWTETDIAVAQGFRGQIGRGVHAFLIAPLDCEWETFPQSGIQWIETDRSNTEREVKVGGEVPGVYKTLSHELVSHVHSADDPPSVLKPHWVLSIHDDPHSRWMGGETNVLVETTSTFLLAVRHVRMYPIGHGADADVGESIVLAFATEVNLSAWFRAFLHDVHEADPEGIPRAPPLVASPADWYTPEEQQLAAEIEAVEEEAERLLVERERLLDECEALVGELRLAGEKADKGIRRIIWEDGDNLVEAVKEVLTNLGFQMQDMDAGLKQGEAKREDLRLTLEERPGWEAIVEVKGYNKGTRTNDARQIGQFRVRYAAERGKSPDLTLWIANPHRNEDPSSRPAPDNNVRETAETIETVHVSATDLYRQWTLVANGSLEASDVVQQLVASPPGLWKPSPPLRKA